MHILCESRRLPEGWHVQRHDCDPNMGVPLPAPNRSRRRYCRGRRGEPGPEESYSNLPTAGRPKTLHLGIGCCIVTQRPPGLSQWELNHLIGLIVALYWCDLPQQLFIKVNDLIGLIVALYWCDLRQQLFVNINHLKRLIVHYIGATFPKNCLSESITLMDWRCDIHATLHHDLPLEDLIVALLLQLSKTNCEDNCLTVQCRCVICIVML